jgi:hypothetical protein
MLSFEMSNATETRFADVPAVTRTHEVLLSLGHRVTRQVNRDGSLGVYTVHANPERADKWGAIPEADWTLCDAAEAAPVFGPAMARPVYATGRYVSTHEHYMATGEDLPCGYNERTIIGWE